MGPRRKPRFAPSLLIRCCRCCYGAPNGGGQPASFDSAVLLSTQKRCRTGSLTASGPHITGAGSILADQSCLQDRGYWEVVIESAEKVSVGVASPQHALGTDLGDGETSWALHSTDLAQPLRAGDVIGVAFDQADYPVALRFYLNGQQCAEVRGPVSDATPIIRLHALTDSVVVNFGDQDFSRGPPNGFTGLLRSRSII